MIAMYTHVSFRSVYIMSENEGQRSQNIISRNSKQQMVYSAFTGCYQIFVEYLSYVRNNVDIDKLNREQVLIYFLKTRRAVAQL